MCPMVRSSRGDSVEDNSSAISELLLNGLCNDLLAENPTSESFGDNRHRIYCPLDGAKYLVRASVILSYVTGIHPAFDNFEPP